MGDKQDLMLRDAENDAALLSKIDISALEKESLGQHRWMAWVPWLVSLIGFSGMMALVFGAYLPLREEADSSARQLYLDRITIAKLRQDLTAAETERVSARKDLDAMVTATANTPGDAAVLQGLKDQLDAALGPEIDAFKASVTMSRGQLMLDMVDGLLFDETELALSADGRQFLGRVAEVLAKTPERRIQVSGFTDSGPVSQKLSAQVPSNWELSTLRAGAVARALEGVGVAGQRLVVVGYAHYRPMGVNDPRVGRQINRRIQIALQPLIPLSP